MTVAIVPASDPEARVWATTLEVSELIAEIPWVLIGAQMVMLLEREAGRPSGRTTGDVDVVIDVRVRAGGTTVAAQRLVGAGFELGSAEHPHRFVRGMERVDLLAPDHLGAHADLTTIPPAKTSEIPGGSRALATRRLVDVDVVGVGAGTIPIPSLAGAIVIKVRAWQARGAPRDVQDLARLLALVADVEATISGLERDERRALGRVTPLRDEHHVAWDSAVDPDDARSAFWRLSIESGMVTGGS